MKKVMLIAVVLLPLALWGCAIAEREHIRVGQFDLSFELSRPYEVGPIDDGIKIRKSSETAEVQILEDKSGLSSSDFNNMLNMIGQAGNAGITNLHIDGADGKLMTMSQGGDNSYIALYSPVDGYYALIVSSMPAMETSILLLGLQINSLNYTQSAIAHSENDSLAIYGSGNHTSSQEDINLAAQIEIENLYHYGHNPGIGLGDFWVEIGDALVKSGKTNAALDAYDKALVLDQSNSRAPMRRMGAIPGQGMVKLGVGGGIYR
jgi:tetratricopeptide (TPR) repeat protein